MPSHVLIPFLMLFAVATGLRDDTMYGRRSQPVWSDIAGSPNGLIRRAPDGATRIIARYQESGEDGTVTLTVTGRMGTGTIDIGAGVGSEILWAPDSRAFAVTTSDGGANGIYRTMVVTPGPHNTLAVNDITAIVRRAFGQPVWCHWPEHPNVGAIRWEDGSDHLIVAAEIVAHSNCDSMGTFRAYRVDHRARRIVASFDQIEAKRRYGADLGRELRAAPDACVQHPARCRVAR